MPASGFTLMDSFQKLGAPNMTKTTNFMKVVSSIPSTHHKAKNKMKAVIHLWKRDKTVDELCRINKIDFKELERWSKLALHGAVNALRSDGLRKVIKP